MPKERAPIATRLRRRDNNPNYSKADSFEEKPKREDSASATSVQSLDDNLSFSPRTDPDIHLDELHSNLSFIRGSEEEKSQHLEEEQDRLRKNFGKSYNPRVKLSTFYNALVAPPIPSKRTRHRSVETTDDNHTANMNSTANSKDKAPTTSFNESPPSFKTDSGDIDPDIPLPLNTILSARIKLNAKDKEKEYWRRQRRAFVHSRFLTNEEGMQVAKSVYSNFSVTPSSRMVTSFQGNIGNFRTKLRRVFGSFTKDLGITKDILSKDATFRENHIQQRLSIPILKTVWAHWIADPYVDKKSFYDNKKTVEQLKQITAKLMVVHFMEHFNMISHSVSRQKMKDVDMISRKLVLPDSSEFA